MNFDKHIIQHGSTLSNALKILNEKSGQILLLFVVNEDNKLVGSLTDGDIRRGLINSSSLDTLVEEVMNKKFVYATKDNLDEVVKTLDIENIKLLPVLDDQGVLLEIVNLFTYRNNLPIEAFIMAGGEGKRLRPLTENTPKPLLKVGDKPIIEHNIDRLSNKGIKKIYVSIKYLGEQLKTYFGSGENKGIEISYVEENDPLGTVGSVSLVSEYKEDTILLMNSDLLTNFDLEEMFKEFTENGADLMVATIPYEVNIPYAVMETNDRNVTSFKEKPTYTYQSNAGIYLFKRDVVNLIPKNEHFNATDLMEKMIELGKSVMYYPILGYWLDIGKHEDFQKAQEDIKHLKF